jgi:hypothetical protein
MRGRDFRMDMFGIFRVQFQIGNEFWKFDLEILGYRA